MGGESWPLEPALKQISNQVNDGDIVFHIVRSTWFETQEGPFQPIAFGNPEQGIPITGHGEGKRPSGFWEERIGGARLPIHW